MANQEGSQFPALEQCSLCSTHYIRPPVACAQPVINRQICKLLEIKQVESQAFFNKYIPVCEDCIVKIKRFEKLRIEIDVVKNEIVSSVLDTLLHIRSDESTPLDGIKDPIIQRWSNLRPRPLAPVKGEPGFGKTTSNSIVQVQSLAKEGLTEVPEKNIIWAVSVGEDFYADSVEVGGIVEVETTDTYDNMGSPVGGAGDEGDSDFNEESKGNVKGNRNTNRRGLISISRSYLSRINVDCQNNPPPFFCDNCGRTYSVYKNAMLHMKACQEDPERQLKICVFCSVDFSSGSWYQLKMHYDSDHPGTVLEKCFRCRREFLPGILQDHLCGGAIIKPVEKMSCELCQISFNTADTLQKHVMRRHKDLYDKGETFACEVCEKVFVLKSMLERHAKVHQRITDSKFQCDICNLYLSTSTGLKQHKTKHTGEMPFECDICHKRFRMSSVLRCHKVVHTKEKNHECNICGEKFSLYSIMYRHWKRHKLPCGEGTYKCPIVSCFRVRFRRVYALKNHMNTMHRGTPEYAEVMAKYKHVDDRSKSKKKREEGNERKRLKALLDRKKLTPKRRVKKPKRYESSDEEEIVLSERDNAEPEEEVDDPLEVQEQEVEGEVQSNEEESANTNDNSPIKRSARIAARAKSRVKSKSKVKVKKERVSLNSSKVEKKHRPGPKSKTKVKSEKSRESTEENNENGVSLDEHGDLITIKDEPVDVDDAPSENE